MMSAYKTVFSAQLQRPSSRARRRQVEGVSVSSLTHKYNIYCQSLHFKVSYQAAHFVARAFMPIILSDHSCPGRVFMPVSSIGPFVSRVFMPISSIRPFRGEGFYMPISSIAHFVARVFMPIPYRTISFPARFVARASMPLSSICPFRGKGFHTPYPTGPFSCPAHFVALLEGCLHTPNGPYPDISHNFLFNSLSVV